MKVWVLCQAEYESEDVLGVYSSKEAAVRALTDFPDVDPRFRLYNIYPVILDATADADIRYNGKDVSPVFATVERPAPEISLNRVQEHHEEAREEFMKSFFQPNSLLSRISTKKP